MWKVKPTAEKGGGKRRTEEKVSMNINELYARMLAQGEIDQVNARKGKHGRAEAIATMKNATKAPQYMEMGEIHEIADKTAKNLMEWEEKTEKERKKAMQEAFIQKRAEELIQMKEEEAKKTELTQK